jgi:hypothetical protein
MRNIKSFDPSASTSGKIVTQAVNPCSVMVLFNHSLYGLVLTFPDGSTGRLPPWYFRYYYLAMPGNVEWAQEFSLASGGAPISLVTGELYEPSEAEKRTFTEGPLPLQLNIGNTVNTNTGTNQVINDGNPAISTVLEATQSGNVNGSNSLISNDGSFAFAQFVSSVYTQLFALIPGASPLLKLGKGLTLQAPDSAGANFSNILGIDGGSRTFLQAQNTGNQIAFYDKNGVNLLTADGVNKTVNIAGTTQSVNGDNGGTAQTIEGIIGPYKLTLYIQTNYRQAGTGQNITLKAPFSSFAFVGNMGAGGVAFKQAGTAQTIQVVTTIASGGGSSTPVTAINTSSIGWLVTNFNQIADGGAMGAARSGIVFAWGI